MLKDIFRKYCLINRFQDLLFNEKRGNFKYGELLKRLESIRGKINIEKLNDNNDDDSGNEKISSLEEEDESKSEEDEKKKKIK